MLVINDLQNLVRHDHAVPGAESVFDPPGKIQPLFDQYLRIRTMLLRFLHLFIHIGAIAFGAVLHFLIVIGKVFRRILGIPSQRLLHQIGAQFVTVGTLLRIGACPVFLFGTKLCGRRAFKPPVAG